MSEINNYQITKTLGKGSFGVTYLGYDKINKRQVAIKTIDVNKSKQKKFDLDAIDDEVDSLKYLSENGGSNFIAKYYDSFNGLYNGQETKFIVSEYIEGQPLVTFIQNGSGKIPPEILWPVMLQLLNGVKYIHAKGFAHRDIKPENILLTWDYQVKYIDFGFACTSSCRTQACTNLCGMNGTPGTFYYRPPESFEPGFLETLDEAQKHDMWSLSVIFYELCDGFEKFPYSISTNRGQLNMQEVVESMRQAPTYMVDYNLDRDQRTRYFTYYLVSADPSKRLTADQAFNLIIGSVLSIPWGTYSTDNLVRQRISTTVLSSSAPAYSQNLENPSILNYPDNRGLNSQTLNNLKANPLIEDLSESFTDRSSGYQKFNSSAYNPLRNGSLPEIKNMPVGNPPSPNNRVSELPQNQRLLNANSTFDANRMSQRNLNSENGMSQSNLEPQGNFNFQNGISQRNLNSQNQMFQRNSEPQNDLNSQNRMSQSNLEPQRNLNSQNGMSQRNLDLRNNRDSSIPPLLRVSSPVDNQNLQALENSCRSLSQNNSLPSIQRASNQVDRQVPEDSRRSLSQNNSLPSIQRASNQVDRQVPEDSHRLSYQNDSLPSIQRASNQVNTNDYSSRTSSSFLVSPDERNSIIEEEDLAEEQIFQLPDIDY